MRFFSSSTDDGGRFSLSSFEHRNTIKLKEVDFTILRDKKFGSSDRSLIVRAATETSSNASNTGRGCSFVVSPIYLRILPKKFLGP